MILVGVGGRPSQGAEECRYPLWHTPRSYLSAAREPLLYLQMSVDPFARPLTGPAWMRAALFLARMVGLRPRLFALAAVVTGLLAFVEGLALSILLPLLGILGVETGAKAGGPAQIVQSVFTSFGIPLALLPVLAAFIVVGLVLVALHAVQQYLIVMSTEYLTVMVRERLFAAASRASWTQILAGRSAHLINAIVGEAPRIAIVYGNALAASGIALAFAVYLAFATWISWQLTLIGALLGSASLLVLRRVYRSSRRFGAFTSAATNHMQEVLHEHTIGAKLIRAFGASEWSRKRFAAAIEAVSAYARRNQGNTILVKTSVEPFGLLVIAVLVYLSVAVVRVPPAELMLLLLIVFRLMPRLVALQELLQRIAAMLPAYEAVGAALVTLEEAREASGNQPFDGLREAITIRDVCVRRGDVMVLERTNLLVPARKTVILIGPSGGGKTTLLDLISGVLVPDAGAVLVDGVPLQEIALTQYRSRIAVVPQDSFFFHETIAANMRIAAPDASDAEIWDALRAAHAEGFVRAREGGLQAVVGDQGYRLSGGQRQRLALGRALLRKPDILLLDEPTSAIDPETEAIIAATLQSLRGRMTIVMVTHRMELAGDADLVYSIADGIVTPASRAHDSAVSETARARP